MRILILGCGPAGLVATAAAERFQNTEVIILSVKRQSPLHGCQYLHAPIPGYHVSKAEVAYLLRGTEEAYARKVYGTDRPPITSPQLYQGTQWAWDLRETYQLLWDKYEPLIINTWLSAHKIASALREFNPDVVLSTIPRPIVCQGGDDHLFRSQRCWALGDAPVYDQKVPISCPLNTVICDATPEISWYRLANVFGMTTVEWSGTRTKPPLQGVVAFDKPLSTTCDCWPDWGFFGRYGQWQKGVLVHQVYMQVVKFLMERFALRGEPIAVRS